MNLYGYISYVVYGIFELPYFKLDGLDCEVHKELDEYHIYIHKYDSNDDEIPVSTVELRNMLISTYNSGTVKMIIALLCGKKECTDQELFEQVNKCHIREFGYGQINCFVLKSFK